MKKSRPILKALAPPVIASMIVISGVNPTSVQGSPAQAGPVSSDPCLGPDANFAYSKRSGFLNFVAAQPGGAIQKTDGITSATFPENAARAYLATCGTLFGLSDQSAELQVRSQSKAEKGSSVVKFQQTYFGIPVIASELNVQLDANNGVQLVNGEVVSSISVGTAPSVSAAAAKLAASKSVSAEYKLSASGDDLSVTEPALWVYSPEQIGNEGPTALVWRMEVVQDGPPPVRQLVLVDAQSGSVLLSLNQLDTARNRMTYDLNNTTTYPGTLRCNEANTNCTGGDADEVSAHVYGADTYNFYQTYHARDSIDNAGMTLNSHVHYSAGYCNAFWDGSRMTYGDGCAIVVDDVVAHEMTHGVTQYESNLIYSYQSGAINESLSDIWGELVDLTNGKGTDTPAVRWLMGEDTSIGAIRDMKNPPAFNNPDRMGSPLYYTGSGDNGGVHTNSGVGNKAAYLITDGDTFNGYTVTGIGITKAAKVYYKAQTDILTSSSNYAALGNALSAGCNLLVGTDAITAADCDQVRKATYATEMVAAPTPVPVTVAPSGIIIDTTPTYNWTPVSGATNYGYYVYTSAGVLVYSYPNLASTVCRGTSCTHTPATALALGGYKWKVRARVGGVWQSFSALKTFTVATLGFDSQFTSDAVGWTPKRGAWPVPTGFYKSNGVANSLASSAHITNYSTLTYEARLKRTGTCTGCTNAVIVRGVPGTLTTDGWWSSAYSFHYTNSGYFSLWSITGGTPTALIDWTTTPAIIQNGWNTLRVTIASNGMSHWFINGTQVAYGTLPAPIKTTGQVGLGFYRDAAVGQLNVDWAWLGKAAPTTIVGVDEGIQFSASGGGLNLAAPSNPNMAP